MPPLATEGRREILCRFLVGVKVGTLAGIIVTGWCALWSVAAVRAVWYVPERMAEMVLRGHAPGWGWSSTVVGVAFHLTAAGALGIAAAFVFRPGWQPRRLLLASLSLSLAWYVLLYELVLGGAGFALLIASLRRCLVSGHVLAGLCLWRLPRHLRAMQALVGRIAGP